MGDIDYSLSKISEWSSDLGKASDYDNPLDDSYNSRASSSANKASYSTRLVEILNDIQRVIKDLDERVTRIEQKI